MPKAKKGEQTENFIFTEKKCNGTLTKGGWDKRQSKRMGDKKHWMQRSKTIESKKSKAQEKEQCDRWRDANTLHLDKSELYEKNKRPSEAECVHN